MKESVENSDQLKNGFYWGAGKTDERAFRVEIRAIQLPCKVSTTYNTSDFLQSAENAGHSVHISHVSPLQPKLCANHVEMSTGVCVVSQRSCNVQKRKLSEEETLG